MRTKRLNRTRGRTPGHGSLARGIKGTGEKPKPLSRGVKKKRGITREELSSNSASSRQKREKERQILDILSPEEESLLIGKKQGTEPCHPGELVLVKAPVRGFHQRQKGSSAAWEGWEKVFQSNDPF